MVEYPVCKLKAEAEIGVPKILNKQRLEEFIWISIPTLIARTCYLYDVQEVCPKYRAIENYVEIFEIRDKYPWIKVKSSGLNQSIGTHVYALDYVNPSTNDTMSIYFAYIIQDDNPEKPYIYMNREDDN